MTRTQIALTCPTDLVEWGIKLSRIEIRIKIAYPGGGGRLLEFFLHQVQNYVEVSVPQIGRRGQF
jgi:hypothetical protein